MCFGNGKCLRAAASSPMSRCGSVPLLPGGFWVSSEALAQDVRVRRLRPLAWLGACLSCSMIADTRLSAAGLL